ncbi:MAG: hypothetical protein V1845_03600 [bacterium]
MKSKYLIYSLVPLLGLSAFIGVNAASAHGFFGLFGNLTPDQIATQQQTMFQKQADLLGISVDDIKNAWAEGKSLKTLAEEKGISQEQLQAKVKEARLQQIKSDLQTLVEKGVITQAQADKRLQFMQNQSANGKQGKGMRGFGFHGMMW